MRAALLIDAPALAKLQEENEIPRKENAGWREKVGVLVHQLDELRRLVVGVGSERVVPESDTTQGTLFEAAKPSAVQTAYSVDVVHFAQIGPRHRYAAQPVGPYYTAHPSAFVVLSGESGREASGLATDGIDALLLQMEREPPLPGPVGRVTDPLPSQFATGNNNQV